MQDATPLKTNEEETYPPLPPEEHDANAQIPGGDNPNPPAAGFDIRTKRTQALILKIACLVLLFVVIGCAYGAFFGGYPFRRVTNPNLMYRRGPIALQLGKGPPLKEVCKQKVKDGNSKPVYLDQACPFYKQGGMWLEAVNLVLIMICLFLVLAAIALELMKKPIAEKTYLWMFVGGGLIFLGAILEITSASLTAVHISNHRASINSGDQGGAVGSVINEGILVGFDVWIAELPMKQGTKFAAGIIGVIVGILFFVAGIVGLRAKKEAQAQQEADGTMVYQDPYQQQQDQQRQSSDPLAADQQQPPPQPAA